MWHEWGEEVRCLERSCGDVVEWANMAQGMDKWRAFC